MMENLKPKPGFLFIIVVATLILSISLFSYNFNDVFYPVGRVHNLAGLFGARLSYFLLSNFGYPAYFFIYLLFASIFSYHKKPQKFIRSIVSGFFFVLFLDLMVFLVVRAPRYYLLSLGFFPSGSFGYIVGEYFRYYLGFVGSVVVVVAFLTLFFYFSSKELISVLYGLYVERKNSPRKARKSGNVALGGKNVLNGMDVVSEVGIGPSAERGDSQDEKSKGGITIESGKSVVINKEKDVRKGNGGYRFPVLDYLNDPPDTEFILSEKEVYENARKLEEKLKNFGVMGSVVHVKTGPLVTMYEFKPKAGVKISKITNLAGDLALAMKAVSVRIVAPIPGKAVVGIEISNERRQTVYIKEILSSKEFVRATSPLTLGLGKDIMGNPFVTDLKDMPHLLIAGSTGAGKSVAINSMILSILYKATPDEVKFVMIDPKMIELSVYDGIPHMLMPVVTDAQEASGSLSALTTEMETRYRIMREVGVRNVEGFNKKVKKGLTDYPHMPYVVVIIDELADLMMVASKKVEAYIARLAQKARAAGIHLIVATQRPSVDVLTGTIKANFSARISFKVASKVDSRTILDTIGAEMLLGKGDMLFLEPGTSNFLRVHGALVVDEEIQRVTDFVKSQGKPEYSEELMAATKEASGKARDEDVEVDELFDEAVEIVRSGGSPTISYIQRKLKIGYNRAARIVDQMEQKGILSKPDERGKRTLLIP